MESQELRTAWDSVAAKFDDFVTETHFALSDRVLSEVALESGMCFLDVASGSGALSLPAARRGADVVAVDISPIMVERLNARATGEGVKVEARVSDGQKLDLKDNSFDRVGSMFGVMLFPNLAAGLSEMTRVTKPDGKVLIIAFGHPSKVEFLKFFVQAVQAVVPQFAGLPMDPLPLPFQISDPNKLKKDMEAAGLTDVHVHESIEETEYASGEHLWNWLMGSNPIPNKVVKDLGLDATQIETVKNRMSELINERASGGKALLKYPINIGIGVKP